MHEPEDSPYGNKFFITVVGEEPPTLMFIPYGVDGELIHEKASFWTRSDPQQVTQAVSSVRERADKETQTSACDNDLNYNETTAQETQSARMSALVARRWNAARAQRERNRQISAIMHETKSGVHLLPNKKTAAVQATFTSNLECPNLHVCTDGSSSKVRLGIPFLLECFRNLQAKRPRYSTEFYDICMVLYLTSAKTYRLLRQVLQMPAISTLQRKYRQNLTSTRRSLLDTEKIGDVLTKVRAHVEALEKEGKTVNTKFTLAIDAFSFRSFPGNPCTRLRNRQTLKGQMRSISEGDMQYSNGFLFLLVPHDYRVPVQLVHLSAQKTGSYTAAIDSIAELILNETRKQSLRVWCRATDGDPGVADTHNQFYNDHVFGQSSLFSQLVTDVHDWLTSSSSNWIPISDPLHIFKNIRAKLLKHQIRLFPFSNCVDVASMRNLLDLGNPLVDESQMGKMRDSYVLSLFTFENIVKLLNEGQYVNACFLLPFASWLAVIFSDKIDLGLRLFLVELSFQILSDWCSEFDSLKEAGVSQKAARGKAEILFSEFHYVKRMLNTLVAFGVALRFGCDNIRMDSLGTHLVENAIGIARATSSDPRFERIVSTYTRAELRKEIAARHHLTIHIPGRINAGGCKVDPDHATKQPLISKPKSWRVDRMIEVIRGLCCEETAAALTDDVEYFISTMSEIAKSLDHHVYNVNETANSTIMARLISFKRE